jgi:hypothetical protein
VHQRDGRARLAARQPGAYIKIDAVGGADFGFVLVGFTRGGLHATFCPDDPCGHVMRSVTCVIYVDASMVVPDRFLDAVTCFGKAV